MKEHSRSFAPDSGKHQRDGDFGDRSPLLESAAETVITPAQLRRSLGRLADDHIAGQLRLLAVPTEVGWYGLAYCDTGIVLIHGPETDASVTYERLVRSVGTAIVQQAPRDDVGRRTAEALIAYHKGERIEWDTRLELTIVSPFTRDVLLATARIPYGQVRTYAWVAAEAGHPKAVRAVGNALHVNPWAPIVPCHRVVSSTGGLGGYAKGLAMKEWYLRLEGYVG